MIILYFLNGYCYRLKGDTQAQYAVGWMYDLGKGLIEDPYSAMKWYRKAASQKSTSNTDRKLSRFKRDYPRTSW
jgi:TPR repeat protein